jgi:hypothetical protein
MDAYEREEEDICRREAEGEITHKQAQEELSQLRRDYRGAAEEAAEDAYRREMDNW